MPKLEKGYIYTNVKPSPEGEGSRRPVGFNPKNEIITGNPPADPSTERKIGFAPWEQKPQPQPETKAFGDKLSETPEEKVAPEGSYKEVSEPKIPRPGKIEVKTEPTLETLEKDFKAAYREMVAFRHGKKIADLSEPDQVKYKQLREVYRSKRGTWLKEDKKQHPEKTEPDYGSEKLNEVEVKFKGKTNEQVISESEDYVIHQGWLEVANLDAEIKNKEGLMKTSLSVMPTAEAEKLSQDIKELKERRKKLSLKIIGLGGEKDQAGEAKINHPEEPAEDQAGNFEYNQAEAKAARRRILEDMMIELDRRKEKMKEELTQIPTWKVFQRMDLKDKIDAADLNIWKYQRELDGEKVGFGKEFVQGVRIAYRNHQERAEEAKIANEASDIEEYERMGLAPKPAGTSEPLEASENETTPAEGETSSIKNEVSESRPGWWGWFKERGKGLLSFGFWEVYQAERFRKGTSKTAKEMELSAAGVQHEYNLSLEDAMYEAQLIQKMLENDDGEWTTGASAKKIEKISQAITSMKIEDNDKKISDITLNTIASLEEKLKKYKGVSGQDVLTEDAKNKIAAELQKRLNDLRANYIETDVKELTSMLRENLEKDWWKRYVYGALEAATVSFVGGFVGGEILASSAGSTAVEGAVPLKTTIWAIAKQQCIQHGITHPSNAQIMKVSIQLCKDSGVKVVGKGGQILWSETAKGVLRDTALRKGFPVIVSNAGKIISSVGFGAL